MTSTRIEISFNKVARLDDLADLAEMLFPGNRNQQHAFLVVWITLKWAAHRIVPNFTAAARANGISRRILERVRAKMRRIGLIDHVSRFNAASGYREGWVLSNRFERSLRELAERIVDLKDTDKGSPDKDKILIEWGEARRRVTMERTPEADVQVRRISEVR